MKRFWHPWNVPARLANATARSCAAAIIMAAAALATGATAGEAPAAIEYGQPRRLCNLADARIKESSGLVASVLGDWWWTHNDSGDDARLYAIGRTGKTLHELLLAGVRARDWEDLTRVTVGDTSYLVVGDVGDNNSGHNRWFLHVVAEPDLSGAHAAAAEVAPARSLTFTYSDGKARDCEAIAAAPDGTLYLVSKSRDPKQPAAVFTLPWPAVDGQGDAVAQLVATVPVLLVTAMDISADGRRLLLVTYLDGFEYSRGPEESWAAALRRRPRRLALPPRWQGEAGCYGHDGRTIYLTSEQGATPLFELAPK
jgi:hypothetical protein